MRATDTDGLESFSSEPLEVTGPDLSLALQRTADGLVLRWDAARGKTFSSARVSEIRSVLPDKELASVSGVSEVALPDLAPGTRLAVAFVDPSEGGGAAPLCHISVPPGS